MLEAEFSGQLGAFQLDTAFDFPERGVTVLFGPSGCGKTSILRCIAGLTRVERGRFAIGGETWQDERTFLAAHRRRCGYVFQEANLFPHMSVRKNLLYGARRAASGSPATPAEFGRLVDLLGLSTLLDRSPVNLSGGERQRVAIGRAILSEPRILLMDEPLSALDHANKRAIFPYLQQLHQAFDLPIVYVTHATDELVRLADHVVLLDGGKVTASGPLLAMQARLDLPFSGEDEAGVSIEATIRERDQRWHLARASFDGGDFWVRDPGLAIGAPVRLMVRARDVSLALTKAEDVSILNRLPATVVEVRPGEDPSSVTVRLDLAGTPLVARLTALSAEMLKIAPGAKVWAQVKSVAVVE